MNDPFKTDDIFKKSLEAKHIRTSRGKMSELLENLRMEQEHYNCLDGLDRYKRIKAIADHIQDLEAENAKLKAEIDKQRMALSYCGSQDYIIEDLEAENAKLKAELVKERDIVNRLEAGETSYFILEKQARQRQEERDQSILKEQL